LDQGRRGGKSTAKKTKNGGKTEEARGNSYTCIIIAEISVNSPTVFEKNTKINHPVTVFPNHNAPGSCQNAGLGAPELSDRAAAIDQLPGRARNNKT
jgi:hypothetical protein